MFWVAFFCLFMASCVWLVGTRSWKAEFQPVAWREFLAAIGGAAAFLIFVYNCEITYETVHAGSAVFLALMIPVFLLGGSSRKNWKLLLALSLMLAFSAFRILCIGSVDGSVTELCALFLIFVLAAVCCETPMKREVLPRYFFTSVWHAVPRGLRNFQFALHLPQFNLFSRVGCAAVLVPIFLVFVFGSLFVLANPAIQEWLKGIEEWLDQILLHFDEVIRWLFKLRFWRQVVVFIFAFCGLCGLLAPRIWAPTPSRSQFAELELRPEEKPVTPTHIAMYWNSLFALIILFAVDLTFDFYSLLTWKPPVGFDYGTYCHEGAFWLTMALGLATLVLAGIFRQKVCSHEKVNSLKRLAFIWIAENALLALTIYVRLGIYVQRSGLTCLRVVGFFGTTAVAVGIVWMALKLRKDRPAGWLLGRYTWTVAALIWLYSVMPVDFIVWKYNMAAFQAGNNAVLVHVADQFISGEGLVPLFDLLQSENPIVRNGAAARIGMQQPKKNSGDWRNHFLLERRLRKLYEDPKNQKLLEEFRGSREAVNKMREYGEQEYR